MHDKSELEDIVSQLPKLWADYRIQDNYGAIGHPFRDAIAAVSNQIPRSEKPRSKKRGDWWNNAIAWLDANYPIWRGYEAPKVREVA